MNTNEQKPEMADELSENPVAPLLSELQSVDENHPDAPKNQVSISDNNGGRIELSENPDGDNAIRKIN